MDKEYDDANYDDYDDYATCESEGMSGNCGEDCRVLLQYKCHIEEEVVEGLIEQYKNDFSKCDEEVVEIIEKYLDKKTKTVQDKSIADFDQAMKIFN